jgi:hypothetical protein
MICAPQLTGADAGLIGAAAFATAPVSGYPPGTPDALTQPTRTAMIHNLAAVPVSLGLPAAPITCRLPVSRRPLSRLRSRLAGGRESLPAG